MDSVYLKESRLNPTIYTDQNGISKKVGFSLKLIDHTSFIYLIGGQTNEQYIYRR